MLYYLNGILSIPDPTAVIIDCGGVGYKLTVSASTLQKLAGQEGKKVKLYTYMEVKEDDVSLFGFFTEEELTVFRQLITVSGVGPKAAVSILSVLTPEKLRIAVAAGDVRAITAASGVGKKIAERVILELKEKLPKIVGQEEPLSADSALSALGSDSATDALNALLVLGYNRAEAAEAIRRVEPAGKSLEEIVRLALRYLLKQ